jgi:hypothetical protein
VKIVKNAQKKPVEWPHFPLANQMTNRPSGRGAMGIRGGAQPPAGAVTGLLQAWSDGDDAALEQLLPLVEAELKRLARGYMARERRGHTLQATALINEAFLRLTGARRLRWQDRAHFLGISARLMRRVLVDHARARGYQKRGGGAFKTTLDEALVVTPAPLVGSCSPGSRIGKVGNCRRTKEPGRRNALLRRAECRGRPPRCCTCRPTRSNVTGV